MGSCFDSAIVNPLDTGHYFVVEDFFEPDEDITFNVVLKNWTSVWAIVFIIFYDHYHEFNPFMTGNTIVLFELAKYITLYVVPKKHFLQIC